MRIVISKNDLDELATSCVVLDTAGIPRTKIPEGTWCHGAREPITASMLADGRPMVVLYDAGDPRASLRPAQDIVGHIAALGSLINTDLLPFYDFAVCWNRHHTPDHQLELS